MDRNPLKLDLVYLRARYEDDLVVLALLDVLDTQGGGPDVHDLYQDTLRRLQSAERSAREAERVSRGLSDQVAKAKGQIQGTRAELIAEIDRLTEELAQERNKWKGVTGVIRGERVIKGKVKRGKIVRFKPRPPEVIDDRPWYAR